jgi:hypothetical protein
MMNTSGKITVSKVLLTVPFQRADDLCQDIAGRKILLTVRWQNADDIWQDRRQCYY